MTKEEEIKEAGNIIYSAYLFHSHAHRNAAMDLYDANYRKQVEAEWIVVEKEGYWIPDITVKSTRPVFKCSACEKEFGLIASQYNYCSNCGAKMVGRR